MAHDRAEDVFERASKRALQLRNSKRSEKLSKSRSKARELFASTSMVSGEPQGAPQTDNILKPADKEKDTEISLDDTYSPSFKN